MCACVCCVHAPWPSLGRGCPTPCTALPCHLQYGANEFDPTLPVHRIIEFKSGPNKVFVNITGSHSKGWDLATTANGHAVNASKTLPNGVNLVLIKYNPESNNVASRVIINAGAVGVAQ